ncbi:hypothetical protein LSAT2_019666 [Lamellibrachia satsuma]|nr:hypothetical protein LSAT2_019666 [Lamellibrachia satsuma]
MRMPPGNITEAVSANYISTGDSWANLTPNDSSAVHNATDELDRHIWLYAAPVLFIVGLCGNSLTVAVSRRKRLRNTTVSVFLSAMALADNLVLITGILPEWLSICFAYEAREESAQACKWSKFLAYGTGDVAIWILAAFTCDRFVAVCFPMKKRSHFRPRGALLLCACVCCAAVTKNAHLFWTRGAVYDDATGALLSNCGRPPQFAYFEMYVRPWIAFALVSVLPLVTIAVCNATIIWTLARARVRRTSTASSYNSHVTHTAVLCLSASFTFLVCIVPSIVLLIGKPYWTHSGHGNPAYDVSKAVCNLIVYVNHSINFFLYCMTGGRFRHEFVVAVREWTRCKPGHKATNGHSLTKIPRSCCSAQGKTNSADNTSSEAYRSSPKVTITESIA